MDILPQILTNGIIAGALYGLIALGFNFIYGTVKFFDLAYGSVLVMSGYGVFLFTKTLGLSLVVGLPLSILICALFGLGVYRTVYTHLQKKRASNMAYIVASLGVFTVVQAIIAISFTSQFQTIATGAQTVFRLGSVVITQIQLLAVLFFILISVLLALFLGYTRMGKAARAVADDASVSEIIGINTKKITSWVFVIGSVIGAIAGIITAYDTGIEPTMGFALVLKGVIAAIIGGVGNIWGGVLGALGLGLIENLGVWQFSAEWKDVIAYTVLIIVLVFRPQGIFKKKSS